MESIGLRRKEIKDFLAQKITQLLEEKDREVRELVEKFKVHLVDEHGDVLIAKIALLDNLKEL